MARKHGNNDGQRPTKSPLRFAYYSRRMLRVHPWRTSHLYDISWLTLAKRCFSTGLSQSDKASWQVSSHGRYCNSRGVVSAGTLCPSGYHTVKISNHNFYLHRLVTFAFLGPPPNPLAWQVHHIDGNKSNNCLENLEYTTPRQNILYSLAKPSRGNPGQAQSKPVMWRAVGALDWKVSPSIASAAIETGVSTRSVRTCCSRKTSAKGFEFRHPGLVANESEIWRQMRDPESGDEIPGRMVSSLGRCKFLNGRISAGCLTKQGYYVTHLNFKNVYVHRLVAAAFLGRPPTPRHIHINHKDYDKGNNSAENLEYITASENIKHSYASPAPRRPTSNVKPVESRLAGSQGRWIWHPSIRSAARACGLSAGTVSRWAHDGRSRGKFDFRLAENSSAQTCQGEEWRDIDFEAHLDERFRRKTSA